MHPHVRTPASQDKRLWLTAAVIAALIVARGLHVDLGDKVIDAILLLTITFVGQSQAGQVLRANKLTTTAGGTDAVPAAVAAQPSP